MNAGTEPRLSVIIPARNEQEYIERALASVASQSLPLAQIEAVVVDNASTDGTAAAIDRFRRARPDLAVLLASEPVAGVSRTKNLGARSARGEWLIFMDADSRMAPDLAAQVLGFAEAGFAAGSIRVVADSEDWLDRAFFGLMEFGKRLFSHQAQMFFCSRALFIKHRGFREDLRLAEDREFLARVQQTGVPMCQVDDSWIATSPRRLRRLPMRLNVPLMFVRWALANWGIGRTWRY